ncbi:MAG: DUF2442 domain-containing protein [Lachnospiraceae bacterium]|nr:DUF2442 domain-containing protein [Lachnospiraceae bacterium]
MSKLDFTHFHPEVFQAAAGEPYIVYAYMNDGSVRKFNAEPLIDKGGVFEQLKDTNTFRDKLTVLNGTVAWDIGGNRDEYNCIDIDPFVLFECEMVPDIPEKGILT